jgi:probable HAF family extracellular repeat protein
MQPRILKLEGLEERCLLSYTIVDLGTISGFSVSLANGVNDLGQVAGYEFTADLRVTHGFVYDGVNLIDLPTLGGTNGFAEAINNAGQIAGFADIAGDAGRHAFLYDSNGPSDLGTLGGANSYAYAINSAGQVAGEGADPNGNEHAFFWDSSSGMQDLGTLGGLSSYGFGINDADVVVGTSYISGDSAIHAFLAFNGRMHDLGTLGAQNSWGSFINNPGQVVGYYGDSASNYRAFVWDRAAGMQDIGTLGGNTSYANGINDVGQIVGNSSLPNGIGDGFLYSQGVMQDLNDLLPAGTGWHIYQASAINNEGQIVGQGFHDGAQHAYLMTPDDAAGWPSMSILPALADHVFATGLATANGTYHISLNTMDRAGVAPEIALPNHQDPSVALTAPSRHDAAPVPLPAFRLSNLLDEALPDPCVDAAWNN